MHSDSILSLLCWGFRKHTTEYGGKVFRVDSLLNDPKPGLMWVCEPSTIVEFVYNGEIVVVRGCFQHVKCKRLSATGEPFSNFICGDCSEIVRATDFRLRVLREGCALVKRGSRDTESGRRVDYLSSLDVAPLASASCLIHSSQWRKPHGSLKPCTRKGHDAPTQHGPHPCKVSPQPLVSPIQAWDLSSKSPCSPLSR